jgi:uncharacterized membrane protein
MRRSILLAAFALAACGKAEEPKNVAPPEVASNFAQPFDAVGTDPAWGLKIRGVQMTLTRPGQPEIVANAPGAVIQPGQAAWTAAMPDGRSMKVSVYASACSDASGVSYLYSAEVVLPAQSPLVGCAGPPASAASKHP